MVGKQPNVSAFSTEDRNFCSQHWLHGCKQNSGTDVATSKLLSSDNEWVGLLASSVDKNMTISLFII